MTDITVLFEVIMLQYSVCSQECSLNFYFIGQYVVWHNCK